MGFRLPDLAHSCSSNEASLLHKHPYATECSGPEAALSRLVCKLTLIYDGRSVIEQEKQDRKDWLRQGPESGSCSLFLRLQDCP